MNKHEMGEYNPVDKNKKENEIGSLPMKEFMDTYPENGFGWAPVPGNEDSEYNKRAQKIFKRWKKIRQEHPELFPKIGIPEEGWSSGRRVDQETQRRIQEGFAPPYRRNLDGQIVGPNNEPIRPGSPAWRDAARHNLIPRNQTDKRRKR